jgi:hypothetical protein
MAKVSFTLCATTGVLISLIAGCRGGSASTAAHEAGPILKITREFIQSKNSSLVSDPAIQGGVAGVLSPLRSLNEEEQQAAFRDACKALNMYQLSQVSSIDDGVNWVSTQGRSSRARTEAVRQLAESLVQLNQHPTVLGQRDQSSRTAGVIEVTGSGLCLGQ